MTTLVNFLLFQAGWFACVLGGAHGYPMTGTAVALSIVIVHVLRAARPRAELTLVLAAAVLGGTWDSALTVLGWFTYPTGMLHPQMAPYWIIALWMVFATTLNVSLRWLKTRPLLTVPLGAVGGPLAYYAGHALGAVDMSNMTIALGVQGIGWALLLPVLVWLSLRLDGVSGANREVPCLT